MVDSAPHAARLAAVEAGFRSLPDRYLGADPGVDATWRIVLGDVGHTWEVRCTTHGARARKGATNRRPDVVIGTDAATWIALRVGARLFRIGLLSTGARPSLREIVRQARLTA